MAAGLLRQVPVTCSAVVVFFDCSGMSLRIANSVLGSLRWDAIFRYILTADHVESLVLCRVGACFQHMPAWDNVVENVVSVAAAKVSLAGQGRLRFETELSIPDPVFL